MEIKFSRAKSSDYSAIQRLYALLVNDSNIRVTEERISALESDPNNILVVSKIDGAVIASAFLVICLDVMYGDQPFALVENIVVDPAYRRNGVGAKLMKYIHQICRDKKCTKVLLSSSISRSDAHRFFERNGYRGDLKRAFVNYLNREQ
jgi:GNAT superfamily N-acetyltransferase